MPDLSFIALALAAIYGLSACCIYHILLNYRTAQGAVAWIVGLLGFPYLALPLFLFFGRNRFSGYVQARRLGDQSLNYLLREFEQKTPVIPRPGHRHFSDELQVLCNLARQPFTAGNHCSLLKDGQATFEALFNAMEEATDYILMEFYIVRSDRVGQRIKRVLERKLAQGVRVYFIYDDIGSAWLPKKYLRELSRAGAHIASFDDGNMRRRRLQLNFRNHRKLLVCDGRVGFVGGINLGDEYLGTALDQGPWRDSHCRIEGPAALGLQMSWVEDWYWANNDVPELNWQPPESLPGDQEVLILPTGPADPFETCALFFLNCINNARERIWITSPYFVPDYQVINALQLAALRGVDVRILIPEKADSRLIHMAAYSFLVQATQAGVHIYQYRPGFMHQKVLLVDDRYACVGTANLDNRSMRLNFEITALTTAAPFVAAVESMLTSDLAVSRRITRADYEERSLAFRITCRALRLAAPVL